MGIFEKLKTGVMGITGQGLDGIALLRQQHRDLERLFVMVASADSRRKQALFNELADSVALHAELEEKIFYPASKGARTQEVLLEAVEEHLSIKRLLADMLEITVRDDSFDAKLKVLREQIEHHVEEEEDQLFPRARGIMGQARLTELGAQMEALAAELQDGEPRHDVADQTESPAPI